jgi:hypothetical protein
VGLLEIAQGRDAKGEVGGGVFDLAPAGIRGSWGGRRGLAWFALSPPADRLPTINQGRFRGYLEALLTAYRGLEFSSPPATVS